jgi:hypothetical protein
MSATRSTIARPSSAMLAFLYIEQQWGCPDIGWLYERDATTIHNWLRESGIHTRSRGSDPRQHFPRSHQLRLGTKHTPETIEKVRVASIARGAVPYLRDGKHWLAGAAPEDNPRWAGGATPERQEFYRTPEWKAACRGVWARANACCERCALDYRTVDRDAESFHVHHVVPFAVRELRGAVDNLVLLCRPCHLFVHSKANTEREFLPPIEVDMPSLFEAIEEETAA